MLRRLAFHAALLTSATVGCADDDAAGGATEGSAGSSGAGTGATAGSGGIDDTSGAASTSTGAPASGTSSADTTSSGGADTSEGSSSGDGTGGGQGGIFEMCFGDQFVNTPTLGPDYDQFDPIIGSHCLGTNHQDITDVERVVFLGDSVTVGTPPTLPQDFYRARLADTMAAEFALMFGTGGNSEDLWRLVNPFSGQSLAIDSGAFSSCAKWGARTDDLLAPGYQIEDCFPPEVRDQRTLVIMTMGGNDVNSMTQHAIDGATEEELWAQAMDFVALQRSAVQWLKDPTNFPNGAFVVFANNYEFTDGTGDVMSCDVSGLAGFDQPIPAPDQLTDMVVWINEQYMSIAVDYQADMIFLLEAFCGHGFSADDPSAPCYRGPGAETWFDLTCIHPTPTGHEQIADMFTAVIDE